MSLKKRRAVVVSSLRKRTRHSRNFSVERHIPSPFVAALAVTVRKNHDSAHSPPHHPHPTPAYFQKYEPKKAHVCSFRTHLFCAPFFLLSESVYTVGMFCPDSEDCAALCSDCVRFLPNSPIPASFFCLLVPRVLRLYNAPDVQKRQFH